MHVVTDRVGAVSGAAVPGWETVRHITVPTESLDSGPTRTTRPTSSRRTEGPRSRCCSARSRRSARHRPTIAFEHGLGSANHYGTRPEVIHALLAGECRLSSFDLDGGGPYSAERFASAFHEAERVNFLARPYGP